MVSETIDGTRKAYLKEARAALRASDPIMRRLVDSQPHLDPYHWKRASRLELPSTGLFGLLLRQIVSQQISVSAARAILGRLATLLGDEAPTPRDF